MTDPDGAVTADSADYANKLYGSIAAARGVDLV
jgi:hypothetical protein